MNDLVRIFYFLSLKCFLIEKRNIKLYKGSNKMVSKTFMPFINWDSPGKNTGAGCHFLLQCIKVKSQSEVAQSCPTLSEPMDCSPPGSTIHGIFQGRVLEWIRWYKPTQILRMNETTLVTKWDLGVSLEVQWLTLRFSPWLGN